MSESAPLVVDATFARCELLPRRGINAAKRLERRWKQQQQQEQQHESPEDSEPQNNKSSRKDGASKPKNTTSLTVDVEDPSLDGFHSASQEHSLRGAGTGNSSPSALSPRSGVLAKNAGLSGQGEDPRGRHAPSSSFVSSPLSGSPSTSGPGSPKSGPSVSRAFENSLNSDALSRIPVFPHPYSSAAMCRIPGSLCVFGGVTDGGSTNETWLYDLEKQVWRFPFAEELFRVSRMEARGGMASSSMDMAGEEADMVMPTARCGHSMVVVPQDPFKLLTFGGSCLESGRYISDVWQLSAGAYPSWDEIPQGGDIPFARLHATSCVMGNKVFLYGGEAESYELLGDIHAFDIDRRRWLDMRTIYPYPPGRQLHAAAALPDETMWVVGGIGDKPLTDVWVFDAQSLVWREVRMRGKGPFDGPNGGKVSLSAHTLSTVQGKLVLIGGRKGHALSTSNWIIDTVSEQWVEILPSPDQPPGPVLPSRWKHCSAGSTSGDCVYVSGGLGTRDRFADMWKMELLV